MKFTKMQGLGNDYIYIYSKDELKNPNELSIKLSNRNFGIGSDGIVLISSSEIADFKMRIFNADGTEANMCGNGIRCVGKYVYDKGLTNKTVLKIETLSGIKTLYLNIKNDKVFSVKVEMGKAAVGDEKEITVLGKKLKYSPVDIGNPHIVILSEELDNDAINKMGSEIQKLSEFPGGVNVEFITINGDNGFRMRVFERGSGITMACGTGACASSAFTVAKKICKADEDISVHLDGGVLKIKVSDNGDVIMDGPAVTVFEGDFYD